MRQYPDTLCGPIWQAVKAAAVGTVRFLRGAADIMGIFLMIPGLILYVPVLLWTLILGKENYYNIQGLKWGFPKQVWWVLRGKPMKELE